MGKAVNFTKDFDIPVLGLVENMAYFVCDDCNKKHYIYGQPQGEAVAAKYGIGAYTTLPMDPRIAMACDKGDQERNMLLALEDTASAKDAGDGTVKLYDHHGREVIVLQRGDVPEMGR